MFTVAVVGTKRLLKLARISAAREGDISREISQMPGKTRMEQVQNFYKATTKRQLTQQKLRT
jgi:hypothetical protein